MNRISHLTSSTTPTSQVERALFAHALRSLRAYERAAGRHDESGMTEAWIAVSDAAAGLCHGLERLVHREMSRIRANANVTRNLLSI